MKVRMKTLITGTTDGKRWPGVGETIVVSDGTGKDLCANGYAEPVAQKPSERAETRTGKTSCPEDGCDYEGSQRGLKIHTGQVHGDA